MPDLPIQVWAAWIYALWWLFVAIRDYSNPTSPRYKNGKAFYLALVAVAQLAWIGYLLLEGFSQASLAVLVAFGFTWLLWMREARKPKTWDFFFSYRTKNANEVRRLAERLMADGYSVWFAEYEIVLHNYDEFETLIREGIRNCLLAILFTTNNYTESEYCRDEVIWLKQRFKNEPWRIIEVSLEEPNHARSTLRLSTQTPKLITHLSPQVAQNHSEDDELLTCLASLTGLNVNRSNTVTKVGTSLPRFQARCAPISFDPSGFTLKEWKADPDDGTDVAIFEGKSDPVPFGFNVYFQYSPQKAPGQSFTIGNDREIYKELRNYVSGYFMKDVRKHGVFLREHGLHLIWINGHTQFAITHSFLRARMRKYSVILKLPRPIELIFTFGVTGSFEDFYRFVPLMDRVIESIRIEPAENAQ